MVNAVEYDEIEVPQVQKYDVTARTSNAMLQLPRSVIRVNKMHQMQEDEGRLLIDGGCDTSLVGNGFYVESTTNRTVDVQGFADDIKVESLPIVLAVTAVDMGKEVVLLELHECIAVAGNQVSLLSTFQAREAGVIVNDITKQHNGKQNIECDDLRIPLVIEDGLMVIKIREPTEHERMTCERLTLTDNKPWIVGNNDDDNFAMMMKESRDHSQAPLVNVILENVPQRNQSYLHPSRSDSAIQNPSHYQAKLGWMPINVIEKTLKNTTQLAKNHIRLPLRRHF